MPGKYKKLNLVICLLMGFMVHACATTQHQQKPVALAGTSWQLVSFQSMDDSQGTTAVDDSGKYTLTFSEDGKAALRLDCNRGIGSWESTPSADGSSGTLKFGPLAVTRALCPPPSLGEKLARDLDYVRSYLLKDGRLYLSLMADAGIYEWHAE
jgi:heat shock protein HslJ